MELTYQVPNVSPHRIIKTDRYWTYTEDNQLVDILCGNTSFIFGYNNTQIFDKMIEVQSTVGFLKGLSNETCAAKDELVEHLCKEGNFYSVSWAVSGSDGVEMAFYINDQYWKAKGYYNKSIVVFNPGYHGTTFLAKTFRGVYPRNTQSISVQAPMWDYLEDREFEEHRSLEQLKTLLTNDKSVGAILMEACPWANGIKPWSEKWWQEIRDLCDQHSINFIVDDVFAGVGKLGHYFSHNRYRVQPDICVLGKSLTNGYSPLSCACVNKEITEIVEPYWDYSHTWSPNMGGVGAALAVKDMFDQNQLVTVESRLTTLCNNLLTKGLIKNFVVIGLLANITTNKEYPVDFLIKNNINGFVSDGGNLKICAPAIADDEYFEFLEINLQQALLGK